MSAEVATVTPMRRTREHEWLSPADVEQAFPGITETKLKNLRDQGKGPRYYKPTERTVIYDRADVNEWIARSVVTTRDAS